MVCNTAVFYDIENLMGLFTGVNSTTLQLDEIYRRILELDDVSGVSIQKAYADWAIPINRNLRNVVLQIGIEPVQIFNTNQNDKVKNAADVSLIIDAVELLSKRPDITNYVIVSGDGIFAFLSKKLHEYGKRVIGCGFHRNSNVIFRNACDYYISLEKSDKSLTAVSKKSKLTRPSALNKPETAIAPAEAIEPVGKIPSRFPKNKFTEALAEANLNIWLAEGNEINSSLLVLRDLVNALFSRETEETADLEISVFKTYVDYYIPGFKISDYRFKRFNEFLSFLLTGSPYCLYAAESNIIKITRRSSIKNPKTQAEDKKGLVITTADGKKLKSVFDIPDNTSFTYSILPPEKSAKKPTRTRKPRASKAAAKQPLATPQAEPAVITEGSIRKWIKNSFGALSNENKLPPAEVRRMTTPEYTQKIFGIRTPVLREVVTRSNLQEQRTVNGKIKYWKDVYKFNGKSYLVYKEWNVALHRDRFAAWLGKF
jgi:hypothetical protein